MPPLIAFAGALGGLAVVRWAYKTAVRINRELEDARMARVADKYAIIRSMRHTTGNHPAAAYWMMVGSPMTRTAPQVVTMSREDRPHPGAALARLLPRPANMPAWVMVPEAISPVGPERPGQHAGFLGAACDPYRVNSDPNSAAYSPGAPGHHGVLRACA